VDSVGLHGLVGPEVDADLHRRRRPDELLAEIDLGRQGFGRGVAAMIANAVRLIVSAGAGLAAVYWLDLGIAGFCAAVAAGFALYAVLLVYAVVRVKDPGGPTSPQQ
jgi:ABC-type transport system involved in Fe-S cluster assembly fused permease/ATPase subunit